MAANDSRMSAPWSDCRPRYAIAGAVVVGALLLHGCATMSESYWQHVRPAQVGAPVLEISDPSPICIGRGEMAGERSYGCYLVLANTIILRAGMPPQVRACVLAHERRHAAGDVHSDGPRRSLDCGDETVIEP